jgi:hypothetical protein
MRTVKINLDDYVQNKAMQDAIGYLAIWALPSYDTVKIGKDWGQLPEDTTPDLLAQYENTETGRSYVIGAVWNEEKDAPNGGHYSFHS